MKAVLIYDDGEQCEPNFMVKNFESKESMIDFVNEHNIGKCIIAAYEVYREIKI